MTRITPRTCLYPLTGSLLLTFTLSIALTFRSDHNCYAGTCGEWLFPLQARLHVVIWYFWVSISVAFLGVRAFHPQLRRFLVRPLLARKLPLLGKRLTISGLLAVLWIISLYGIVVGVWWIRLQDYFVRRGSENGVDTGNNRLAAIALTGHVCDVTMGMALIPISRHSALASFFKLSVSTTLAFHMLTAYTLFSLVLLHGFLYVSWVPVYNSLSTSLRMVFPVLNPTYLYNETWPGNTSSLGVWRASLIFTGIIATAIFCLMFITTLPRIRGKHFNLFYFTHLLGIVAVIVICLHASTMFYCTAPGLVMWVLDWGMRLYELRKKLDGKVISFGNGWYRYARSGILSSQLDTNTLVVLFWVFLATDSTAVHVHLLSPISIYITPSLPSRSSIPLPPSPISHLRTDSPLKHRTICLSSFFFVSVEQSLFLELYRRNTPGYLCSTFSA